ncbi:MAG: phosphotransferase [Planctomycetaceae bacterium]|nr:phosphotransferase [Planctomycetaceae bacterium]
MTSHDLNVLLARYPAIVRPLDEPETLGNAGGWSGARLWRFATGLGPMVARAWPPDGPDRPALRQIHATLAEARGLGFVPVPERDRFGETIQESGGRLCDVSPWMPGAADRDRPPSRPKLHAAFAGLAAFHRAVGGRATRGPSPGLRARLGEIEALIRDGFAALRRAVERAEGDAYRESALCWLALAERSAPACIDPLRRALALRPRLQPCLRDARPEHFLFDGDRLTGLIDFGAMGLEVVSADLARLMSEWLGPDRLARVEALDAYAAVRPLDEAESSLIDAFESSAAVLGAGHWVRWHFLEGRTFDDPEAVSRGIVRGLERLSWRAIELKA